MNIFCASGLRPFWDACVVSDKLNQFVLNLFSMSNLLMFLKLDLG